MDRETEDLIKREVVLLVESQVRDRLNLLVDHQIQKQLVEIVELQVSDCIGKAIGKSVTSFLRKNQ
jgi:hypothetical protein